MTCLSNITFLKIFKLMVIDFFRVEVGLCEE
jgi:hypothetical protein